MTTNKRMTSIHISAITDKQIAALKESLGLNQSEIITMAIDRLFQQEIKKETKKTKKGPTPEMIEEAAKKIMAELENPKLAEFLGTDK